MQRPMKKKKKKRKFFRPNKNNNNNFNPSSFFSTSLHNYYSYNVHVKKGQKPSNPPSTSPLHATTSKNERKNVKALMKQKKKKGKRKRKEREIRCISFSTRVSFHRFHPFRFATQFQFSFHQPVYIFLNIKMGHSVRVYFRGGRTYVRTCAP